MDAIFLVEAKFEYVSNVPVVAFENADDAEAFVEQCTAYEMTRPTHPAANASAEEFEQWDTACKEWRKQHPAGDVGHCDAFTWRELPFGQDAAKRLIIE